MFKSLKQS